MPSRHEYLARLSAEARRKLPTAEAETLVGEAAEHLDDSLRARLELGDAPALAEAGAVAAFGSPGRLVHAALAVRAARRRSGWLALFALSAFATVATALGASSYGFGAFWAASLALIALVPRLMASLVARRPLRSLAAVVAALGLGLLAFNGLCLTRHDGVPVLRSEARLSAEQFAANGARLDRTLARPDLDERARLRMVRGRTVCAFHARAWRIDAETFDASYVLLVSAEETAAFAAYLALIGDRRPDPASTPLGDLATLEAGLTREAFLRELDAALRRELPGDEAAFLVAEAEDHLRESVQARLELGEGAEAAERSALTAFGTVGCSARAVRAVRNGAFQRLFLALATLAGVGWGYAILASPLLGRGPVVIVGIVFFATYGRLVVCSGHRRPLGAILAAAGAYWALFTPLCAWWIRDFSVAGWLSPLRGPVDVPRAALWALAAAAVYLAYLLLAYRMARPAPGEGYGSA